MEVLAGEAEAGLEGRERGVSRGSGVLVPSGVPAPGCPPKPE